jgi:ABC-type sugar transport system ATPase subunit
MILHSYVHVFSSCDRVNLISSGVIALDKPTAETSVDELTEIVVEEYRRARRGADRRGEQPGSETPPAVDVTRAPVTATRPS